VEEKLLKAENKNQEGLKVRKSEKIFRVLTSYFIIACNVIGSRVASFSSGCPPFSFLSKEALEKVAHP